MAAWHFSSALSSERREALARAPAFANIIRLVASQMEILCCHRPPCDDMAGFSRVLGGYHIQADNVEGLALGRKVGNEVWEWYLQKVSGE